MHKAPKVTSTAPKKPAQGLPPQSDPDRPLRRHPKAKVHQEPPKPTFIIFTMPDQLRHGAVGCCCCRRAGTSGGVKRLTAETRQLRRPTATVAIFFTMAVGGACPTVWRVGPLIIAGGVHVRRDDRDGRRGREYFQHCGRSFFDALVGKDRDEPKGVVGHRESAFSEGGSLLSEEPLL